MIGWGIISRGRIRTDKSCVFFAHVTWWCIMLSVQVELGLTSPVLEACDLVVYHVECLARVRTDTSCVRRM